MSIVDCISLEEVHRSRVSAGPARFSLDSHLVSSIKGEEVESSLSEPVDLESGFQVPHVAVMRSD